MSKTYVQFIDGMPLREGALPTVYENVSGFDGLADEDLAKYGFYPLVEKYDDLNRATHRLDSPSYELKDGVVTRTVKAVPLNEDEIQGIVAQKWMVIREKRNQLLAATDWTQLADTRLSTAKIAEYREYRDLLRDIPQNYQDPDEVVWPLEVK